MQSRTRSSCRASAQPVSGSAKTHFTSHACSIHHHLGVVLWRIRGAAVLGVIHVCDIRMVAAGDSIVPPAASAQKSGAAKHINRHPDPAAAAYVGRRSLPPAPRISESSGAFQQNQKPQSTPHHNQRRSRRQPLHTAEQRRGAHTRRHTHLPMRTKRWLGMCRRWPWLWNQDPWVKVMCSAEASARAADILLSLQAPQIACGRQPCRHQRQKMAGIPAGTRDSKWWPCNGSVQT